MESPGEYLKREREVRGVSLMKIFEATRVPLKYLEAIEADRFDDMPHSAFIKGFIKSYCKVLGLDETDAVLRYEIFIRERAAEEEEKKGLKPAVQKIKKQQQKAPEKKRAGFILPAAVIAGIIILVFAYAKLRRAPQSAQPIDNAPVATQPAAAVQEPAAAQTAPAPVQQAPITSPAQPVQQTPAQAPAAKPAEQPAQPPAASPVKAPAPKAAQPAPVPAVIPAQPAEKAKQAEPVKETAPKPDAAKDKESGLVQKPHTLTANASEDVWMKIGIDGGEPVEVLLREGQRFSWKAFGNFSVLVGNAGGVTLSYNGRELPQLGASGQVVSLNLPAASRPGAKAQAPAGPIN